MRVFNALSSLAVMACVVVISFVHSLDLFRRYGFEGYLAWLGVIAVEVTFFSSMLNIVVCRLKQRPAGMPSYIGGLLGVSLVAWSNVSATFEYGLPGVVLGLFVPGALVVSESIMSYAVIRGRTADTKRTAESGRDGRNDRGHMSDTRRTDIRTTDVHSTDALTTDGQTKAGQTGSVQATGTRTADAQTADIQAADAENRTDSKRDPYGQTDNRDDERTDADKQTTDTDKWTVDTRTDGQGTARTVSISDIRKRRTANSKTDNRETGQRTNKRRTDRSAIADKAIEYYNENGTLPSVRKLAEMYGCSKHMAHETIKELKAKKIVS